MTSSSVHDIGGSVDPETIYSRQNCIGKPLKAAFSILTNKVKGGGSFGKVYKGFVLEIWHFENPTHLYAVLIEERDKPLQSK